MKTFGYENQHNNDYAHHTDPQPRLDLLKDENPEYRRLLLAQRSAEGQYMRRLRRIHERDRHRER